MAPEATECGRGWRGTVPAILLLALASRTVAWLGLGVIPRDGAELVRAAAAVAGGDPGAALRGTQHPLYLLLAGALGGTEGAAVLLSILAGSLAVLPMVRIGDRLHSRSAGILAALLYATAPAFLRSGSVPLAEPLYLLLALWSVERGLAAAGRPAAGLLAGLWGGLAYLTRPEALLLLFIAPWLLTRRRAAGAALFALVFLAVGGPYAGWLSAREGRFSVSPKKPVARFLAPGEGFDAHMREKAERTGITRPGPLRAAAETARTYGEALSWILLPLALLGAWSLLSHPSSRPGTLLLLALLAAALALCFRLLSLQGYLGRRHLLLAAALSLPPAAVGLELVLRRRVALGAAILAAGLLAVGARPRDRDKIPFREAGRAILAEAGPGAVVATYRTPRIAYYARGTDLRIQRCEPGRLAEILSRRAGWLAVVPARLPRDVKAALGAVTSGRESRSFGEGAWRVLVWRLR